MKKNECNVVRDLMPLVLDRVASDESRALVEEHMGSCGECRKQYEEMKADMPAETRAEYEAEQRDIVRTLKQMKRQKKIRRILRVVLPAVISLVVLIGGMMLYGWLWQWDTVPLENNMYTLSLAQQKDGTVHVIAERFDTIGSSSVMEERMEGGQRIIYVYFRVPMIHSKEKKLEDRRKGDLVSFEKGEQIDEIRQGSPDNYKTIWKKGDPMPEASEEMEAYLAHKEERWRTGPEEALQGWNLPEDEEEMEEFERRSEELFNAVPEWK